MFVRAIAKPKSASPQRTAPQRPSRSTIEHAQLLGNQAMLRLLAQRANVTSNEPGAPEYADKAARMAGRAEAPSWDFSKIPVFPPGHAEQFRMPSLFPAPRLPGTIQAKLKVGAVDDPLEQEADRVADQVMRMPAAGVPFTSAPMQLSHERATCEQGDEKLQEKATGTNKTSADEAPAIVHEVLRSSGEPLDDATRAYFEPRFGLRSSTMQSNLTVREVSHSSAHQPHDSIQERVIQRPRPIVERGLDFSNVRIHADAKAGESAKILDALAYTVDKDIVFRQGCYQPQTHQGRRLLAHELSHVLQQRGGGRERNETQSSLSPAPSGYAQCQPQLPKFSQSTEEQIVKLMKLHPGLSRVNAERAIQGPAGSVPTASGNPGEPGAGIKELPKVPDIEFRQSTARGSSVVLRREVKVFQGGAQSSFNGLVSKSADQLVAGEGGGGEVLMQVPNGTNVRKLVQGFKGAGNLPPDAQALRLGRYRSIRITIVDPSGTTLLAEPLEFPPSKIRPSAGGAIRTAPMAPRAQGTVGEITTGTSSGVTASGGGERIAPVAPPAQSTHGEITVPQSGRVAPAGGGAIRDVTTAAGEVTVPQSGRVAPAGGGAIRDVTTAVGEVTVPRPPSPGVAAAGDIALIALPIALNLEYRYFRGKLAEQERASIRMGWSVNVAPEIKKAIESLYQGWANNPETRPTEQTYLVVVYGMKFEYQRYSPILAGGPVYLYKESTYLRSHTSTTPLNVRLYPPESERFRDTGELGMPERQVFAVSIPVWPEPPRTPLRSGPNIRYPLRSGPN
jgi:Domain of unknown function (DUF4157)